MPWSSGVFSRTDGTRNGTTVWQQAKAAAVKILASDHDTHDQDLAVGINNCLTKDGQNAPTSDLAMAGRKHTNVEGASARSEYASAGQVQDGILTYGTDTGIADAPAISPSPVVSSYASGQVFRFKAANTNTGPTTLNVSGLGVRTIKKNVSDDLSAGEIVTGQMVTVIYDGTNFQLASSPTDISGKQDDVATTRGDLVIADANPVAARLPVGGSGEYLRSDGTDPAWSGIQSSDLPTASDSARGALETATKAEAESASALDRIVVPGRVQYHPGVAKAWVSFNGTGAVSINESYNVSSITDNGVGDYTVNFTTAFGSTTYVGVANGDRVTASNTGTEWMQIVSQTASAFRMIFLDNTPLTWDQQRVAAVFFGGQ